MNDSPKLVIIVGGIGIGLVSLFFAVKKLLSESAKACLALEVGGTGIKVVVHNTDSDLNAKEVYLADTTNILNFETSQNPQELIKTIFKTINQKHPKLKSTLARIGISNFGPIRINPNLANYGEMMNTPKPGWKGFNIVTELMKEYSLCKSQICLETDVNAAALFEYKYGNHNAETLAYITIGTGVGVGIVCGGKIVHGFQHPEGGHIMVKRLPNDDFEGICYIHKDCLEGMVTNHAIVKRCNLSNVHECKNLNDDDEVWDITGYYIANLCLNLVYLYSIEKIVIGGGIINRQPLLEKIQSNLLKLNNNYIEHPNLTNAGITKLVQRTAFKNNSGILSALFLD